MTIDTTADDMRNYAEQFIQDIDIPAALTTPNMDGLIQLTLRLLAEVADQIERVNALVEKVDRLERTVGQNELDIARVGDTLTDHLYQRV